MKLNIHKHTIDFFPREWQKQINLDFADTIMKSCFNTANVLNYDFQQKINTFVGYSAQRLSLEQGLNAIHDPDLKRITVVNGTITDTGFIFNEAESVEETYVYNISETLPSGQEDPFFFNENEPSGATSEGFFVNVPIDIIEQETSIIATIERVQVTGTFYEIVFF